MKKVYLFSTACACAALLFSCAKEVEALIEPVEEPSVAKNTYVFAIGSNNNEEVETKTILGSDANGVFSTWESGDNLIYKINTEDHGTSGVTIGTPVTFTITDDLVANDIIYAWFPYCVDETGTPDDVWFNVPHSQSQGTNFDLDAMPMVAKPITMTPDMITAWTSDKTQALADVQFANLGSLINFKVYNTNAAYNSEKLRSITFNAGASVISGTFALDLTAIDFGDESTVTYTSGKLVDDGDIPVGYEEELGRSSTITTTMSSNTTIPTSKASALDVYMVVLPGTYAGTITVTTTKANYSYPLSSREFARSGINKLGLNLNSANATRVDYVTLDWTFPGTGRDALEATIGVSQKGLSADYSAGYAPYLLKFDTTGDYIIVKTDKSIGKVSIPYQKAGGATNSSFTIQESTDGETFTDVETLTTTGSVKDATGTLETTNLFADDSRYVKMVFTKESNVGVGGISITQLDPSTKRITVQSNLNVPVEGAADATLSYTAQNFVDDITVSKTGCVSSASKTSAGIVTYTVGANYESSVASGTIVLTSAAAPSITRTVSVSQPASSLTSSAAPTYVVTIPNDANTASFTITTPDFAWNATAIKYNEDVNLQIETGVSTYSSSHSGPAGEDAQTITVYSTTAAGASQKTLGTVTIFRTATAGDDPQAITVTVKKESTGGATPKTYSANFEQITAASQDLVLSEVGGDEIIAAITVTGGAVNQNVDGTKGAQVGTKKSPCTSIQISVPFTGSVSSITLNTSCAAGTTSSLSMTVGETSYTRGGYTSATTSDSATDYTFTGSSEGTVVITISSMTKAVYLKSISVTGVK